MAFIDTILQKPSYGWMDSKGELIVPTNRQLFKEAFSRVNVFKSRRNWLSAIGWFMILCMTPFLYFFLYIFLLATDDCVVGIYAYHYGTHGTIWYHRYATHRSYKFSNPIWRFITQNLVIRTVPEEVYVISHHVHHAKADLPGDPYNSRAGFMYCLLAEINHQGIAKKLTEADYTKAAGLLRHTGVVLNSYAQYHRWGSLSSPYYVIGLWLLNWAFWYTVLYFIGGHGLATALFSAAMLWFALVRMFNYTGHGKGKDKHVDGLDYDRSNLAINQSRPGLFTGEWHNNHHLYPASARAGFLPYQLDLAWIYIYSMYKIGVVSSYRDSKREFLKKYRGEK